MARHTPLTPDRLNDEQEAFWREVTQGDRKTVKKPEEFLDKDGSLVGPFGPWLHLPGAAQAVLKVSSAIRFNGSIPTRLREVAILAVAAHWRANYMWGSHSRYALQEGLSEDTIAAIKDGSMPASAPEDEREVHRLSRQLLTSGRIDDGVFLAVKERLGEPGLVELILLLGQYSLFAMTMTAFEVESPALAKQPFD